MPAESLSRNTEIKWCPFCGEKAELRCTAGPYPDWFVQCTGCRASADVFSEDNLTGWNDRAQLPTSDGFSAGDMAYQGAKAFVARDGEVEQLRAKLAEAQEVLRDCIEVGELDAEAQWKAERVSKGRRLYVDDRALSPSSGQQPDNDWHMNPCKKGHRDVGACNSKAFCHQCDEMIAAATTQEAFEQWNATHPASAAQSPTE